MKKIKRLSGVARATATGAEHQIKKSLGFGETPARTATRGASSLSPNTPRFKRGDVGPDGRVFWGYRMGREGWLTREKFDAANTNLKLKLCTK